MLEYNHGIIVPNASWKFGEIQTLPYVKKSWKSMIFSSKLSMIFSKFSKWIVEKSVQIWKKCLANVRLNHRMELLFRMYYGNLEKTDNLIFEKIMVFHDYSNHFFHNFFLHFRETFVNITLYQGPCILYMRDIL